MLSGHTIGQVLHALDYLIPAFDVTRAWKRREGSSITVALDIDNPDRETGEVTALSGTYTVLLGTPVRVTLRRLYGAETDELVIYEI